MAGKCGFFVVPNRIYDGGTTGNLSASAQVLLLFYFRVMNRTSSPRFVIEDSAVECETGLSPNTMRKARKELVAVNSLHASPGAGGGASCTVHLVNPESQEEFPDSNSKPAVYAGIQANKPIVTISTDAEPVRAPTIVHVPDVKPKSLPPAPASVVPKPTHVQEARPPQSAVIQKQQWRCYSCKGLRIVATGRRFRSVRVVSSQPE